jgi:hypothetical protein
VLALGACTSTRSSSINHLIDADLQAMSDTDYKAAVKSIAAATREDYPRSDDANLSRDAGPRSVLAYGDGAVVVTSLRGALHITAVDAEGKRLWSESQTLGKYQISNEIKLLTQDDDVRCLRIPVDMPGCRFLIYALQASGPELVRAEAADGSFAGTAFAEALPIYKYSRVKLESSTGVDSLTALLRLSSPKAKLERSQAAVRSQLEAFSASTRPWVAEAAAAVLILPSLE